jgi:3-isopropylmalate dehydrogenase
MSKHSHLVGVIPGDLNGTTVTKATLDLYPHLEPILSKPINHMHVGYNVDYFLKEDITELRDKELARLASYDQIFLGAIGDPTKLKPGVIEVGLLLKVRQELEQSVNLRPVVLPEGVDSPIVGKDHRHINFEICRENSEGLYVADGKHANVGQDDEYAEQIMRCSYQGVKRLAEFALGRARARKRFDRPRLHFVFKNNVLTYAAEPWKRVENEMREANPDADIRYMHIDNFMMQMITKPEQFDVVVTENMFGDISTDLGAVLQGGIGTAVSGNINLNGHFPSMFEPIHGTAPDKWYDTDEKTGEYIPGSYNPDLVQTVKPEAAFMSYAMMLEHMGETRAAKLVHEAALNNIRDPRYGTKHLDVLVEQARDYIKTNRD